MRRLPSLIIQIGNASVFLLFGLLALAKRKHFSLGFIDRSGDDELF